MNNCVLFLLLLQLSPLSANFLDHNGEWQGELLWKQNLTGEVHSSPILTESKIYLGSNSKKVFCLGRITGEILWTFETMHDVKAPGVIADGYLYIGSYDKHLYALDTSNGTHHWNYTTVSAVRMAPVIGLGSTLLFGSKAGVVYCLNGLTGEVLWDFDTGLDVGHPLVVNKRRVFAASDNHILYCLKTKNGKKSMGI